MTQVLLDSVEKFNQEKFIFSRGFSDKNEMIEYLKKEESSAVMLQNQSAAYISNSTFKLEVIAVNQDEEIILLRPYDICFIESSLRKTKLHTENHTYISNKSMSYYEKKLKKCGFFRSHKSFLINLDNIEKCTLKIDCNYKVVFKNINETAEISRLRLKEFKTLLEV